MARWQVLLLFMGFTVSLCAAKPGRTKLDNDGIHPMFVPPLDAWRDWINPPEEINEDWFAMGQAELTNALEKSSKPIIKPAKNVIVFVGDGMGISTVSAARVYMAQSRKLTGSDAYLSFEKMPHVGLSRTYATDQTVPDSANTATALFCGVKCREGVLGANQHVVYSNCSSLRGNKQQSVLRKGIAEKGMVAGIVTTSRVTHATPASTYCSSPDRDWEADSDVPADDRDECEDIASQLITEIGNQDIRVVLGGGRAKFMLHNETDPEYPNINGTRLDTNLLLEWEQRRRDEGLTDEQFSLVYQQADFDSVDPDKTEYLMGLFEPSHMNWNADRDDSAFNNWAEPSIAEMTEKAIKILQKHDKGFFLLVEGARIDSAHHENLAMKALNDTVALQDAVQRALDLTSEDDTLILTTADHSHVFTMAGYGMNNHDILVYDDDRKPQVANDNKPYLTLGYTNGPGYYNHRTDNTTGAEVPRKNVSEFSLPDKDFLYDAGIPLFSETHAGEEVGIWARGPMAHLVHTSHEQSYFAHLQMYALCLEPRTDLCDEPEPGAGNSVKGNAGLLGVVMVLVMLRRLFGL